MMSGEAGEELYGTKLIRILEAIWGEGFLSPGGEAEVARLVSGVDFAGRSVLDIGCGAGGIDVALAANHGAGFVTGMDVEDGVLTHARALVARRGLADRIGLVKVAPGPLPFPTATFDIVFSKDSIVHIPDKHALMREVFRVLKPGGWFVASDWLIGHDGQPSPEMAAYIAAEGLDFGMASPEQYRLAMAEAGFVSIESRPRGVWYAGVASEELARLQGPLGREVATELGEDFVAHNIEIWERMVPVLKSGEHCPTHLRALKPA
jgi:ubiquinone/menaquinone biosynthesis C-methylase UbiE